MYHIYKEATEPSNINVDTPHLRDEPPTARFFERGVRMTYSLRKSPHSHSANFLGVIHSAFERLLLLFSGVMDEVSPHP